MLAWRRALQFAPDPSLDEAWFSTFERSRYGDSTNSIDLRVPIERRDGAYDFISLSGVLEFIPDDRDAFAELARIGSSECIIHVTFVPFSPQHQTQHYSEPHGTYGRHQLYGADAAERLMAKTTGFTTLVVSLADPITGVEAPFHFFCRKANDAHALRDAIDARVPGSNVMIDTGASSPTG